MTSVDAIINAGFIGIGSAIGAAIGQVIVDRLKLKEIDRIVKQTVKDLVSEGIIFEREK